jgi:hypothetical protein
LEPRGQDPRKQGRAGCGPAGRLGRRRHVDHFEEIAGLVQRGDCATSAGVNSGTRPQQANCAILELEHGAISNPDHGSKFGKVAFSDTENAPARRFAGQPVNLNKFGLQFTRESQSL